MSENFNLIHPGKHDALLNIVKNTVGESFLRDVDEKINCLLHSDSFANIIDKKYTDAASVQYLCEVLNSVKLILEIVEWSVEQNKTFSLKNGIDEVFQSLRDILDWKPCDTVIFSALDVTQVSIRLCIKICDKTVVECMAKFYLYHLHLVQHSPSEDDLRLRLRVISVILTTLQNVATKGCIIKFKEECQNQNECVVESRLFSSLILKSNDTISAQALLTVLPHFVEVFDTSGSLLTVWNEAVQFGDDDCHDLKHFTALCYLFDLFLCNKTTEGLEVFCKLLQDEKYWRAVQYGLTHSQPVARRQALYLLKRSIQEMFDQDITLVSQQLNEITGSNFVEKLDGGLIKLSNGMKNFTISNSKMFIVSSESDSIMWWHAALKEQLANLFQDVFLVLETLEEKQAHIVKPIFQTMIRLIGPTVCPFRNGKRLHVSWIVVLFEKILQHDNAAVVRWGLLNLMEVEIALYQTPNLLRKIIQLLVSHLSNPSLYLTEIDTMRTELKKYFRMASTTDIVSKSFFQVLIEEICAVSWSPEPLFLLLDALQDIKILSWETEQLEIVRAFVATSIATHYTFLRAAIQCHLLQVIMNLVNVAAVSLDSIAELLAVFRGPECLQRGTDSWSNVATWLEYCFSKRNAEDFILANLHSVEQAESGKVSRMVSLLYDAHLFGIMKCCGEVPSCKVITVLTALMRSFKGADKRLYAPHERLVSNLHLLRGILKENLAGEKPERSRLVELMLPYFADILAFIVSWSDRLSSFADYNTSVLFIEVFELILKAQKMFLINSGNYTSDIFLYSLKSLGIVEHVQPQPLVAYVCMHYLQLIVEYVHQESAVPRLKLIQAFFKKNINVPLSKPEEESSSGWGRINGKYLEAQWKIIGRLRGENLLTVGQNVRVEQFLSSTELSEECLSALELGDGSLLQAVLAAAEDLLPELADDARERLVQACWTNVWQMRRNEAFGPSARRFITVVFQPELVQRPSCHKFLLVYSKLLLTDQVNGLANSFLTHAQTLGIKYGPSPLWEQVLVNAALFGGPTRREDRLTQDVCSIIASLPCSANKLVANDWNCCGEVRARALQVILTLTPGTHTDFADGIAEVLLNKEVELTGNKSRSFAGSPVHLIRNRVLQTLLVLEPLLSKEKTEYLYAWLCELLLRESQQPSVRYMTEWLIVRILWRNKELLSSVWLNFTEALEQRVGSLCSFISIVYHTTSILSESELESWLDQAILQFLPYCLAQHFSLRLYAQMAIEKLWNIAESRGYQSFLEKYQLIRNCQRRTVGNGNALRNAEKMREDFYWTTFHPLKHYSLQTIFRDLPRLAHLKPEEWISPDTFSEVGVPCNVALVPWSSGNDLWLHPLATWSVRNEEISMEIPTDNIQKKMIPIKSLLPDYDEMLAESCSIFTRKKQHDVDGLVIVASLVDRAANLGGLSRTCEAFGVSELVIDSLQILEDKQFQSLSVTAEKWLRITEIKIHYLSDYILQMKNEGYTVVGAEQTSQSRPLQQVQFPRKSILLLGSEKEGLPPKLLPLLDICVEVPQFGVVRSLNVHVTGALFVWEYAKQHTLSQSPI